jgi:hypothetical protein
LLPGANKTFDIVYDVAVAFDVVVKVACNRFSFFFRAFRPDDSYGDAVKDWLGDMFEVYVPACLRWLKKNRGPHCPEPVNMVTTCFRYLGAFLEEFPSFTSKRTHLEHVRILSHNLYLSTIVSIFDVN